MWSRDTWTESVACGRWSQKATDGGCGSRLLPIVLRYCVEKGSITVSGVSLTVAALEDGAFAVALVPHTLHQTTLGELEPGDEVNIEVDVIGKYVERLLDRPGYASKDGDPG